MLALGQSWEIWHAQAQAFLTRFEVFPRTTNMAAFATNKNFLDQMEILWISWAQFAESEIRASYGIDFKQPLIAGLDVKAITLSEHYKSSLPPDTQSHQAYTWVLRRIQEAIALRKKGVCHSKLTCGTLEKILAYETKGLIDCGTSVVADLSADIRLGQPITLAIMEAWVPIIQSRIKAKLAEHKKLQSDDWKKKINESLIKGDSYIHRIIKNPPPIDLAAFSGPNGEYSGSVGVIAAQRDI